MRWCPFPPLYLSLPRELVLRLCRFQGCIRVRGAAMSVRAYLYVIFGLVFIGVLTWQYPVNLTVFPDMLLQLREIPPPRIRLRLLYDAIHQDDSCNRPGFANPEPR